MNLQLIFQNVLKAAITICSGCGLILFSGLIAAAPVTSIIQPFSEPVLIDWTQEADDDDTGVLIQNNSDAEGEVSIELQSSTDNLKLTAPEGFKLLDTTLYVTSGLESGARRLQIRMDVGRYGGRAGLREAGIRASSIRMLRADFATGRWIRAVRRIVDMGRADIRYLRAGADFSLGHHGFDAKNEYVWAVTDTSGEQFFALGGLAIVPVPAAWLLFMSGSGLLLLVSRKRNKS